MSILLPVLFVVSWVTMKLYVSRKMAILTKMEKGQDLATIIKWFVLTLTRMGTLWMSAIRSMDIPGYRFQNSNFSHANIVAQEDTAGGQDQNKNVGSSDFRITQSQFQIVSYFLKNVSVSNSQAQVNQVGFVSADPQDQNSAVIGNLNRFQNVILNKHAWILDSGATIHVCFDISNFTSYNPIKPINIKLPNGNSVIASYSGTIFSRINLFWKMSYMCQIFF